MNVVQSVWGKFHHFHLARQLEQRGVLKAIYSTYPRRVLRNQGLPYEKIKTFPWLHTLLIGKWKLHWRNSWVDRALARWMVITFDQFLSRSVRECDILISLSGSGLGTARLVKQRGGKYICDRSSSHIRYGDMLLKEEFARWGQSYLGTDTFHILREEEEYELADVVTVPSEFARSSFLKMGLQENKVRKIPFGADLTRFQKVADPPMNEFVVLFVGQVSFRKGVPYLLEAFSKFKFPRKKLIVVGSLLPEMKKFLQDKRFENVEFLGTRPHATLKEFMSKSHVMVLPSIEEGLAYVQGEAMACGCPLISSANTGASDLFEHGREGFIVPIRDVNAIVDKLNALAEDTGLRQSMSEAALKRVRDLKGWDTYGEQFFSLCTELYQNEGTGNT